ncbi:MAG TPA: von Willebrand factor type A domain-containing protein, partial [Opitutaceae bacterium]
PTVTGAAPQPEPPLSVALPPITLPSGKGETVTAKEPVSTFSLHVSDVSFRLAQSTLAAMARGENPPEPTLRAEEIYNALDYDDPYPTEREKVRARIEQSAHPILQQRNLVRIALRVAATGRVAQQPLRLTILLDTSGSMEREDRRLAVRQALSRLMALLGPQDRVTLIGFARQPRLLAENVAGPQAVDLVRLAAETPPDGGTNLEAALTLARELALRHKTAGAQNRIVLLTDGAANLGDADPARLGTSVEALRQAGISFDACGVGLEGTGDAVLESLTRRGDGRYYVLDRAEAADVAFAAKIAGALRPAAENVKVQVRFNPARVGRYRLIGFEKHRLAEQDFRNDQVNAAELSAEEAAVAMYQVEALPEGTGDLGEVSVRFRDPATGEMVERTWTIPHEPQAPAFVRAAPSLQLAGFAAMLAEVLSESPVGEQIELAQLAPTANRLRTMYPQKPRVAELLTMYEQLRRLEKR